MSDKITSQKINLPVLQDYFDMSISDRIKELDKKVDTSNNYLHKVFNSIQKDNSLIKQTICKNKDEDKLIEIYELLQNMDKKITETDKNVQLLNEKYDSIKQEIKTIKDNIDNNSNLEYRRWLNNAIRTQIPVSFYTSKALDDLNKINTNQNKK